MAGRPVGATDRNTPKLTDKQLDKMMELHDRYGMSYRAIGTRYGIGEKMAQRLAKKRREVANGQRQ